MPVQEFVEWTIEFHCFVLARLRDHLDTRAEKIKISVKQKKLK